MANLDCSKEELINEINMLKIQVAQLKKELTTHKRDCIIRENHKIDYACFDTIMEAIPSAIAILDSDRKFIYLNKRAREFFGDDYQGLTLDSILSDIKAYKLDGTQYPNEELPVIYSLMYGKEIRNKEMEIAKLDGTKIPFLVSAAPIYDSSGIINSVVAIFDDITNLRNIEKKLYDSKEIMKTILENTHESIYMYYIKQRKYFYVNPSYVQTFGYTKEELNDIARDEVFSRIHPHDLQQTIEQYSLMFDGSKPLSKFEYRWLGDNQKYGWFSERCKIVRDQDGAPHAIIGIARDITERKEYEEKIAKSEEKYRYLFNSIDELLP